MGRLFDFEPSEFRSVNYPPGKGTPVCPFYPLLEVVSDFTGVPIDQRMFCGQVAKYEDSISFGYPLSGRRGTNYTPRITCLNLARKLDQQLKVVDHPGPQIPDRERRIGDMSASEIGEAHRQKNRQENRDQILGRFRQATFRNSTTSAENPHVTTVNSPFDISDKEAVQTARKFLSGILQVTGSTFISFGAEGCPQSPRSEFVGEMS